MKNLKLSILLLVLTSILISAPQKAHCVTAHNTISMEIQQEKGFISKIVSQVTRAAKKLSKKLFTKSDKNKDAIFLILSVLLVFLGIILGVGLIVLGLLLTFFGGGIPIVGIIVLLLGVFGPIALLFFLFRPMLTKYYERMEKKVKKGRINILSILYSLIPGILAMLYILFQQILSFLL